MLHQIAYFNLVCAYAYIYSYTHIHVHSQDRFTVASRQLSTVTVYDNAMKSGTAYSRVNTLAIKHTDCKIQLEVLILEHNQMYLNNILLSTILTSAFAYTTYIK